MKYLVIFLALWSCATSEEPLKKVSSVDIQKFMGRWYVIANIPTFVEKGAHNAVETYTWNEKKQRIDIDFRFNKDSPHGEEKTYPQKAWVYSESGNEWRVQPLWPLKFSYLVIDLAPDYSWTVIGVPSRSYVWIMARNKTLDQSTYQGILERLKSQKYNVQKIQLVPQH
jgi:apolipoprotein D and lipocalin family protein